MNISTTDIGCYQNSSKNELLSRDEFRNGVFRRDNHLCVMCNEPAQDAHHILERRLFSNGGYYLSNGASLCGKCHILAEQTLISVEDIREKAGIKKPIIPDHLYPDIIYTKWGDTILSSGNRTPGELFHDESVQKVLESGGVLSLYTQYVKYPRTFHCPWSGYIGDDDRIQKNMELFENDIIVTLKMDGENTTMYNDYIHARSLDGNSHWSQSWVRNLHSTISFDIPPGWRVCGENLYAAHSIKYNNLESYFYVFSIWNERNECLSWADTIEWAELLGLPVVPVIFSGKWIGPMKDFHKTVWEKKFNEQENEGYVIRSADKFSYRDFKNKTMKYVRANHVTTATHWKFSSKVEKNKLINE